MIDHSKFDLNSFNHASSDLLEGFFFYVKNACTHTRSWVSINNVSSFYMLMHNGPLKAWDPLVNFF